MKIDKKMIQALAESSYDNDHKLFILCLKLGADITKATFKDYNYKQGKYIQKPILKDAYEKENYYDLENARDIVKYSMVNISSNPYVKKYLNKNSDKKYSVNKSKKIVTKNDEDYLLKSYIEYAIENDDSKLLKKIIKDNNITLNDNRDILELIMNKRMKSKQVYEVYESIKEKISSSNSELILNLIENMFDEKKDEQGKTGCNFYKKIVMDQIDNHGLKLGSIKSKNKNNLLHEYIKDSYYGIKSQVVEFLVNNGVSLTELNREGFSPFHLDMRFTGYEKEAGKIAQFLVAQKLDLTMEDVNGKSILTNLLESELQVQHYIPLMKTVQLKNVGLSELKPIFNRNRRSENLVKEYVSRGALLELKMLEYIFPKHDYKKYVPYSLVNLTTKLPKDMFELLKKDKLKDYLGEIFGVTSSNMTNCFLEKTKQIASMDAHLVFDFLNAGYVLNNIFIKTEPKNPNYMMDLLKNDEIVEGIKVAIENNSIEQTMNFFIRNFSQQQTKILLESIPQLNKDKEYSWETDSFIYDTINMYWQYPEQLTAMFKELKFSNINTFKKLHDYLSLETRKLEQAPYALNQEERTPELKEIHQKNIGIDKYSIYVAQHNYDLINWGSALHNCIGGGGYAEDARDGESLIMGIVFDDEIKYCIEISNNDPKNRRIVQMEGMGRCKLPAPVLKAFAKTLKKAKILKSIKEYTKEDADDKDEEILN